MSSPPNEEHLFTFLYGLFPCDIIRFLRSPVDYLSKASFDSPFEGPWEEMMDEDLFDEDLDWNDPVLIQSAAHPQVATAPQAASPRAVGRDENTHATDIDLAKKFWHIVELEPTDIQKVLNSLWEDPEGTPVPVSPSAPAAVSVDRRAGAGSAFVRLHLAPKEAEHRFLSAGYENCMALYGSQGFDFDHMSTSQMQAMLYQYHRSEVPFIVDVCPRIPGPQLKGGFEPATKKNKAARRMSTRTTASIPDERIEVRARTSRENLTDSGGLAR
ncbi:hypothetical protein PANT_2c00019 [Moesziomyces antarcticus T-34]|uniref:Uncharacterized protein n=1 Tax=Pseudozyma antarctica (strain T-34) TaxID=1151754 RepID=M9LWR7_PSEA3|nr:hypothetical protein PANT_2c00019 [Moesziomyces antarcticus T-34]